MCWKKLKSEITHENFSGMIKILLRKLFIRENYSLNIIGFKHNFYRLIHFCHYCKHPNLQKNSSSEHHIPRILKVSNFRKLDSRKLRSEL